MQLLFDYLDSLTIPHKTIYHKPLFTVEEALTIASSMPDVAQVKNLFLKDRKKKLYLIVACNHTTINLKQLSLNFNKPGLQFTSEVLLQEYLGVAPGSVTPFGLIHDHNRLVTVLLDHCLLTHTFVGFHPLVNTATTIITPADLKKFIEKQSNSYHVF